MTVVTKRAKPSYEVSTVVIKRLLSAQAKVAKYEADEPALRAGVANELLDRALRLNVDEEARKAPAPDPGRKFRVLASITGWYFLNAVFGASPAAPRERRDRRPRARVDTTDFVVVATRPFFPAPSRARATPSIHIFFFFNNPRVDP